MRLGAGAPREHAPDRFVVQPLAVVADGDDHVLLHLLGLERDRPGLRFAQAGALVRRFQPVIDGVAQQVDERVFDLLQHPFVQFHIPAGDGEGGLLAGRVRQVAHHPPERSGDGAERQHSRALDLIFQRVDGERELHGIVGVFAPHVVDQRDHFAQVVLACCQVGEQARRIAAQVVIGGVTDGTAVHATVGFAHGEPFFLPIAHRLLRVLHLRQPLFGADAGDVQFAELRHQRVEFRRVDADGLHVGSAFSAQCGRFLGDHRIVLSCFCRCGGRFWLRVSPGCGRRRSQEWLGGGWFRAAEGIQRGHGLGGVRWRRGCAGLERFLDILDGVQHPIAGCEQRGRQLDGLLVHTVEHVFQRVRHLRHHVDADGPRSAFEAVRRAEDRPQRLGFLRAIQPVLFQSQQSIGHRLDVFGQFCTKTGD